MAGSRLRAILENWLRAKYRIPNEVGIQEAFEALEKLPNPEQVSYDPPKRCPYRNCTVKFNTALMERSHLQWHKDQA
jgi:hypothetical protein